MDLGLALAQYGPFASLGSVTAVVRAAEDLGYDSVWVGDDDHLLELAAAFRDALRS